jgi:hypothetical protein
LRGGIAERGGVRVGHRIIEINGQSVVAVPHERIVNLLATSVGEVNYKIILINLNIAFQYYLISQQYDTHDFVLIYYIFFTSDNHADHAYVHVSSADWPRNTNVHLRGCDSGNSRKLQASP